MTRPSQVKGKGLDPFFLQLLTYARYLVNHRPGEVVPPTSLSSSAWRKDHWQKVICAAREQGVANLPNPTTIDTWFELFRTYKRVLGTKNVPPKKFGGKAKPPVDPDEDNDAFDRALRAYRRATAESDEDDYRNTDDEISRLSHSSGSSASSSIHSNTSSPGQSVGRHTGLSAASDEENRDDGLSSLSEAENSITVPPTPRGPMTRSRTRRTVLPADSGSQRGGRAKTSRAPTASPLVEVEVESLNSSLRSMNVRSLSNERKQQQQLQQQQALRGRLPPAQASQGHVFSHPGGLAGAAAANSAAAAARSEVELLKLVASGGQAAVFLARLPLDSNSLVIVKVFYSKPSSFEIEGMRAMSLTNYAIRLIGEAAVSRTMLQPFERDLRAHEVEMGSFHFDSRGCVTGWCYERLQGDLEHALLDAKRPIGNSMKMLVALQIAYFLRGVHSAGYIFRDLKPSNILLNMTLSNIGPEQVVKMFMEHVPVIKVTDFGLVTSERESHKTRSAGTMGYMPVAQMTTQTYDKSVDVTAFAITVAEIMVSDLMFDISERDSDIEEEFKTLRVVDRVQARMARHRGYIPSALKAMILDGVAGKIVDVERFIEYFEAALKQVAFALDVPKADMALLREGVGTPARNLAIPQPVLQQQPRVPVPNNGHPHMMQGMMPPPRPYHQMHNMFGQQQHQRW